MKLTKIISIILALTLGCLIIASCSSEDTSEQTGYTYIGLRINPEIEMIADENGNIIYANAVNEDGEVVLSVTDLTGLSAEEAAEEFTDTAAELGYFDPNGEKDTVYVGVEGDEEIEEKINEKILDYFDNKGINGKVSEETLSKYAERAQSWGISIGHTKILMRVLDAYPEKTDTELLELEVKDWMKLLKNAGGEESIAAGLRAEYKAAINALKEEYARLFELRAQIDELEEELKAEGADKDAINSEIATLKAELDPLNKEYKNRASEIKSEFKTASKEARRAYKEEAMARQKAK